jgi:hypothetical protein
MLVPRWPPANLLWANKFIHKMSVVFCYSSTKRTKILLLLGLLSTTLFYFKSRQSSNLDNNLLVLFLLLKGCFLVSMYFCSHFHIPYAVLGVPQKCIYIHSIHFWPLLTLIMVIFKTNSILQDFSYFLHLMSSET